MRIRPYLEKNAPQYKIRRKWIQKCIFTLFFYASNPFAEMLCGFSCGTIRDAFPLQKCIQILHRLLLFHHVFVAGTGVGCFHHTGVGVSQQISHQSRPHSILNETVLCAFERAGIEVPARCHTGDCGFCRSKLGSGKVYIPEGEDKRRIADMQFNFIHPCCCYPESDLVVRIN